jgi:hypothetical protein
LHAADGRVSTGIARGFRPALRRALNDRARPRTPGFPAPRDRRAPLRTEPRPCRALLSRRCSRRPSQRGVVPDPRRQRGAAERCAAERLRHWRANGYSSRATSHSEQGRYASAGHEVSLI